MLSLVAHFALTSAAAAQPSAAQVEQTAARLGTRIDSAQVRSSTDVAWGEATAVIDAPVDRVMEVVTDYSRYSEFMPHFRQTRILSRRGANALVYLQASVIQNTTTLWAQMRIFQRRSVGTTRVVEGRMIEGNMEHFAARWEVTPLADGRRTFVRFRILVEPALPLPSSVFSDENVRSARRTLRSLRTRVQLTSAPQARR